MTENELKKLFDKVENKYLKCWKILSSLKAKPDKSIALFQGFLCEALLDLSKAYRKIHQVRQDLIKRKSILNTVWFSKRQKLLADRQKKIIEVIGLGRALGDAFVWLFYYNDRDLLEKHSNHPYSIHMPPGYGGIGEMIFIKNVIILGEYLIIYHGMTTILRIGDISFISLDKLKVAGIGEIKTSPMKKKELSISILMNFTSKSLPVKLPKSKKTNIRNRLHEFPIHMKDRLKRQMLKINKALSSELKGKEKRKLTKSFDFYFKEFENLLSDCKVNRFSYSRFGKGLLCTVYRQRKLSLQSKVSPKIMSDLNKKLNGLIPRTVKLMIDGSKFNYIQFGSLMYTDEGIPRLMSGAIPVFWWPINIELIRRIYFHEYFVVMVYNPAHLLTAISNEGYNIIKIDGKRLDFNLEKEIDGKKMQFVNFWFFLGLITQCLLRESDILRLVLALADEMKQLGDNHKAIRSDLRIFQMIGRPV